MILDDVYTELLEIVSAAGAGIEAPAESEAFLSDIVERFVGTRHELLEHISGNVAIWFRCLNDRPRWIQEAEWQFEGGKPMMFIGQVDIDAVEGLFHDDASIFVFYSPDTGMTRNVIQVA